MSYEQKNGSARRPTEEERFLKACRNWLKRGGGEIEPSTLLTFLADCFANATGDSDRRSFPPDLSNGIPVELEGVGDLLTHTKFTGDEACADPSCVTPAVLATLYESTLPDRRRRGAYYTPPRVVRFMCRTARDLILANYAIRPEHGELRIIDPACGCGEFLIGMHLALEDMAASGGNGRPRSLPAIRLVGVDIDPAALAIARQRLELRKSSANTHGTAVEIATDLVCADSLTSEFETPFDIVIGNPPYGVRADREVRDRFFPPADGAQSRDLYGLFVARGLELLRPGGCLSFLLSDTWRTIRSHRPLRRRLLESTTIRHVIDLPTAIFRAAVNTTILTLTNTPPSPDHRMISADLRNVSPSDRENLERTLAEQISGRDRCDRSMARHAYDQEVPKHLESCPIFTASPPLFRRLTDPALNRLGESVRIVQGLATGDNTFFLRQRPGSGTRYRPVDPTLVLMPAEIAALTPAEKLGGVDPKAYGGRRFVPYDKGADSDTRNGRLANYAPVADYFIDWSTEAVSRLRTRRSARQNGRVASRFQNANCYFVPGITWSDVGFYSPTFRLSGDGLFDVKGSRIILTDPELDRHYLLGLLCSLPVRFFVKGIANHTVSTQVDDLRRIPLPRPDGALTARIRELVLTIISQHQDGPPPLSGGPEQQEIDRLVSQLYGLSAAQSDEIGIWFARRYPMLSR